MHHEGREEHEEKKIFIFILFVPFVFFVVTMFFGRGYVALCNLRNLWI